MDKRGQAWWLVGGTKLERVGGGAYSFIACLSLLAIDEHTPFETEHVTYNIWALFTFFLLCYVDFFQLP